MTYLSFYSLARRLQPALAGVVAFAAMPLQAQTLAQRWSNVYTDGAYSSGEGKLVKTGLDGHVITASHGVTGEAFDDILIAKSDASTGSRIWQVTSNSPANTGDSATSMTIDRNGDIIVVGSRIDLSLSRSSFFAAKYSGANGSQIWQRVFKLNHSDRFVGVAVNSQNEIIAVGSTRIDGSSSLKHDFFTCKLASASGDTLWQKQFSHGENDSFSNDQPKAMALDDDGNVLITGFGQNSGSYQPSTIKLAGADGSLLWHQLRQDRNGEAGEDVAVDASGNVFVACNSSQGNSGLRVVKYRGDDGTQLWVNHRDTDKDFANNIAIGTGGDVVLTGYTYTSNTREDVLTMRISGSTGSTLWTRTYDAGITSTGLIKDDTGLAVKFDSAGNPVVAGSSSSTTGNGPDTVILKYAWADGATLIQQRVGVSAGDDGPRVKDSLEVGPGHITVAGRVDWLSRNRAFLFRLNDPVNPTVLSLPPGNVGSTSARIGARVNPNGSTTTLRYVYGTSGTALDQTTADKALGNGYAVVESAETLTGLQPSTTYFYQPMAVGNSQILRGETFQFTTTSDDATLASLGVSTGELNPSFSPSTLGYHITLPPGHPASTISLTPVAAHPAATLAVNGSPLASGANSTPVPIPPGNTVISMLVTAEDTAITRTYSLTITRAPESYIFSSAGDALVRAPGFTATGLTADLVLDFAPPTGTNLVVVDNTGIGFIDGQFSNLVHGQEIVLRHGGATYPYVVNYHGGDGNDLVLVWAHQRIYSWGYNNNGQLGLGDSINANVPTPIPATSPLAGKAIFSLAAGYTHSMALCSDGSLFAWGGNSRGQLGNGTTVGTTEPVDITNSGVLAGKRVISISAGVQESFAICSDGTIAAWGFNQWGMLGDGSSTSRSSPVAVVNTGFLAGKQVVSVSSGQFFTLALCSDGSIAGWGNNSRGQLGSTAPNPTSTPVEVARDGALLGKEVTSALASADSMAMFLCSDGTAAGLGWNNAGQIGSGFVGDARTPAAVVTSGVLSGKSLRALSPGNHHCVALTTDGTLVAWGENILGTLGNNSTSNSSSPVAVQHGGILAGKTITSIHANYHNSAALCSDGSIAIWGGGSGALGNGTTTGSKVPVASGQPADGEKFVALSKGSSAAHFMSIAATPLSDDSSLASLSLSAGSLDPAFSSGTTFYSVTVPSGLDSLVLTPSPAHRFARITVNGTPVANGSATAPIAMLPGGNLIAIVVTAETGAATGYTVSVNRPPLVASFDSADTIATTVSGYSAGGNTVDLSLGFPPAPGTILTVINVTDPAFIGGEFLNLTHGQKVILSHQGVGYEFVANYHGGTGNDLELQWAATRLATWGANRYGQLGNQLTTDKLVPTPAVQSGVLANRTITAVSGGYLHSLALCSDGTLAAWGYNIYGQLGNGGSATSGTPEEVNRTGVLAGKTIIAISAGSFHNLALCTDGTLAAWGYNNHGQLGTGDTITRRFPVKVEPTGALAGKKVVGITAGAYQSYVWCSDGTAVAWGFNDEGELGDATNVTTSTPVAVDATAALAGRKIVTISAGQYHTLAICADGTLTAWGYNNQGQLGNETTLANSTPVVITASGALAGKTVSYISAGGFHSLAACADGTVAAWGWNSTGQLGVTGASNSSLPLAVPMTGVGPAALSAGNFHSAAMQAGGLVTWGGNSNGQLGDGSTMGRPAAKTPDVSELDPAARFMFVTSGSSASHNLAVIGVPHTVTSPLGARPSSTSNPAVEDADQDGIPDLVEYAFGLDARESNSGNLPQPRVENGKTVIRFSSPAGISGIVYGAEWSATMHSDDWKSIPDTGDNTEHIFVVPGASNAFIRLKVTPQ